MSVGFWQILVIVLIILILFGRNRISDIMGDFGKGISSFKKGLKDEGKGSAPKEGVAKEDDRAGG